MNSDLDQALRRAAEPVPSRVAQPRAQNLLDEVLRSGPTPAARPVHRRRPRLVLAGAALAVAAVALVTVNGLGTGRAYASWTASPSPLPAAEAQEIAGKCASGSRVTIAETRGKYAYANVRTAEYSLTCFRDADGRVLESSIYAADAIAADLDAKGVELHAWSQLRTDEGYVRLMAGRVGSEVAGVDITVRPAGRVVHASVRDGYFIAWYPEGLEESSSNTTTVTLRLVGGGSVNDLSARDLME
ncbi:hypothetical protein [Actinoplanes sp. NBRC 103695]|uniref:hypothetical protein n=1 Tax=Actinoplanes sp. NBRC 103695 TaxID=3032202 RepID=UPI0024A30D1D|nr:hypothetical protein [Actinoplanes sp. NBRC 103695]GLY96584.1 hypothetical protein Acsp02_38390 [Actinoplanes sp. NBRC 103695]